MGWQVDCYLLHLPAMQSAGYGKLGDRLLVLLASVGKDTWPTPQYIGPCGCIMRGNMVRMDILTLSVESSVLCTYPRESACECVAAAAASTETWPRHHHFALFVDDYHKCYHILDLERLGGSPLPPLPHLHLSDDKACEAHAHSAPPLLPPLPLRGLGHTSWADECTVGKHTH